MRVKVTTMAGTYDVTELLTTYTWSGGKDRCARGLDFTMAVSELDPGLARVDCPLGSAVQLLDDGGTALWTGYVVQRKKDSQGVVLTHRCLDRGMYLANNYGWYTFKSDTAESAVRRVCGDFGIPVGSLAATGVKVGRKFAGVALHKIVTTLYALAGEQTGARYMVRFDGAGALHVLERAEAASGLVLAPKVNVMSSSVTESIEKMCNSVAVYDQQGNRLRVLEDADAVAAYGLMRRVVTQAKGKDAAGEAQALLDDGGVSQSIDVECLGDVRLIAGETVELRETSTGLSGVFWVDEDVHTWKNGQYVCRLSLNLRNVVDESKAGTEVE